LLYSTNIPLDPLLLAAPLGTNPFLAVIQRSEATKDLLLARPTSAPIASVFAVALVLAVAVAF
jgi:hypothetical protein